MGFSVNTNKGVGAVASSTGDNVFEQISKLSKVGKTNTGSAATKGRTTSTAGTAKVNASATMLAGGRKATSTPVITPTAQTKTGTASTNSSATKDVKNIVNSGLSDSAPGLEKIDYKWEKVRIGPLAIPTPLHKLPDVGCTMTAMTNGMNAAHPTGKALTVIDANDLTTSFKDRFKATKFTDLSGQGKTITPRDGDAPKIELMKPVTVNSPAGQALQKEIQKSLASGKTVLVGLRSEDGKDPKGKTGYRHSCTAVGYKNGELQVLNSMTGTVIPMSQFAGRYAKPQFDYAYSIEKR
jgi:hypothetical protein